MWSNYFGFFQGGLTDLWISSGFREGRTPARNSPTLGVTWDKLRQIWGGTGRQDRRTGDTELLVVEWASGADADGFGGAGREGEDFSRFSLRGERELDGSGGAAGFDEEASAGLDSAGAEEVESGGVTVGDAFDEEACTGSGLRERDGGWVTRLGHAAVEGGDAVAVGVEAGVAEFGGDALLESLGDEMLEALGFVVDLFEGVIEDLEEKGFKETMVAENFEGAFAAGRGETHTAMQLVVDGRAGGAGEFLQHVGDGGGGDAEVVGEALTGDALAGGAGEGEDGFEVVIDRLGIGVGTAGRHGSPANLLHWKARRGIDICGNFGIPKD